MPEVVITGFDAIDVRFPTSLRLDGSDAMNPAPDYSAAYLILRTSDTDLEGHGFCFTIGRGTEICVQAIRALAPVVVGQKAEDLFADMGGLWRRLVGDSQLRWLGPEKGVIHMATAAVVNAVWDLYAKTRGKPLWKLLADLDPEEIVALVDFRYLTDALTPDDALELLRARTEGRAEREADLAAVGYPAYDTSPGWLGYDDDKLRRRWLHPRQGEGRRQPRGRPATPSHRPRGPRPGPRADARRQPGVERPRGDRLGEGASARGPGRGPR